MVVDLGCAPGGWLQYLRGKVKSNEGGLVVGIDLLPLDPALDFDSDIHFIRGDFLRPDVHARVSELLGKHDKERVDLVLSDMVRARGWPDGTMMTSTHTAA